jgi:hypothetical protein
MRVVSWWRSDVGGHLCDYDYVPFRSAVLHYNATSTDLDVGPSARV